MVGLRLASLAVAGLFAAVGGCEGRFVNRLRPAPAAAPAASAAPAAPARSAAPAATRTPAAPAAPPTFHFAARRLGAARQHAMTGVSWHDGCPVALDDLRIVRISHYDWHGDVRTGRLVINADAVRPLRKVFRSLWDAHFPIRKMQPVDAYGGSDYDSIEADNTSSFNCRAATGSTRFSEHAYGHAIDVNPLENPYVYTDGTTSHPKSRPYLDRARHRKGMAFEGGALVAAFDGVGWGWGGRWPLPTDFQHFSANGR